jgi:protein-tyrosine sulfotransferase
LVTNPRKTIADLMGFLGEPWDDALLAHSEAASSFRDVTAFPQNPEALRPIGTTAVARWQRDMTEQDKQIFRDIAGDLLIQHGYASDNNW